MSQFSDLSKKVGFDKKSVSYPSSLELIEAASDEQIMTWYRFLPSATNSKEEEMQGVLWDKFHAMRRRLEE